MADIQIGELTTQVDVVDGNSLLDHATVNRIVQAVMAEIDRRKSAESTLRSDLDTRSIVDQQRGGKR
jgi:hypothetical protein